MVQQAENQYEFIDDECKSPVDSTETGISLDNQREGTKGEMKKWLAIACGVVGAGAALSTSGCVHPEVIGVQDKLAMVERELVRARNEREAINLRLEKMAAKKNSGSDKSKSPASGSSSVSRPTQRLIAKAISNRTYFSRDCRQAREDDKRWKEIIQSERKNAPTKKEKTNRAGKTPRALAYTLERMKNHQQFPECIADATPIDVEKEIARLSKQLSLSKQATISECVNYIRDLASKKSRPAHYHSQTKLFCRLLLRHWGINTSSETANTGK
ncbi:hypothetical protein KKG71_01665 [Patescibacteria group bacterium]|nr:hypothetical protein [Patescibacteria group bacterium]